ncbi:MAG: hypothetical protein K8T90_10365 [Planctomycetes bacterium]|nr:hypothetical protein [Planctomycetota bacterium]
MRRLRRVFVCSPYRGDVERNVEVARAACRDVVLDGDAPFAPHLLYPDILDDADAAERSRGLCAGLAWLAVADEVLVVGEPTEGMRAEIAAAETLGLPIRHVAVPRTSRAARCVLTDALRCRALVLWADWGALLAMVFVVLGFLLLPGCVADGDDACRRSACRVAGSR